MHVHRLAYASTRRYSPLVLDHLAGDPVVRDLQQFAPDRPGLLAAAARRRFPPGHRAVLVRTLEDQYAGITPHPAVRANLDALAQEGTLTVTTGHQLCLFGGPLYLPFKVLNAVRAARDLSAALDGRAVVPVFWMATEDHDRDEVDHTWYGERKLHWPGAAGGPVGRMPLEGIAPVVEEAVGLLGPGMAADEVADLLRRCWRPEHTLAQAMRLFINGLFGHLGVVCLDADEPALKRLFVPVMRRELTERPVVAAVARADAALGGRYAHQAHAREINLFHLRPGRRSRIVPDNGRYRVLDGGPVLGLDELLARLEDRPEDFSPNVLLRPVYQETVLPNIAYVGGGGELAYWLQLRGAFEAFDVPMPVLLLRTSAAFMPEKHLRQWQELGLSVEELFAAQHPLQARVAAARASFAVGTDAETAALSAVFDGLAARAAAADPTLVGAVEARRQRALSDLRHLGRGFVHAAKQQQQVAMGRMAAVQQALFPGGGLQERRQNIMPMLASHGLARLDALLDVLDPLDARFTLIVE